MSYYALIVDGKVVNTIVAEQEFIETQEGLWKKYWKDAKGESEKRYNTASIGADYDSTNDAFIPLKVFEGWILDSNFQWQPPTPLPPDTETHYYYWDNETQDWLAQEKSEA